MGNDIINCQEAAGLRNIPVRVLYLPDQMWIAAIIYALSIVGFPQFHSYLIRKFGSLNIIWRKYNGWASTAG